MQEVTHDEKVFLGKQ